MEGYGKGTERAWTCFAKKDAGLVGCGCRRLLGLSEGGEEGLLERVLWGVRP